MIRATDFLAPAREHGFRFFTGVPCSYLKPFINYVIGSESLRYVAAANEGDAVAMAAGSELGGTGSICMLQNSGLGNAVSPLSSLTHTLEIPILLIVTHRGQPGGARDEPQHRLMGRITGPMLDLLEIPWERFPTEAEAVGGALERAVRSMRERSRPFAFIMSKGSVEPWERVDPVTAEAPGPGQPPELLPPMVTRSEMLAAARAATDPRDILIATTGYTGRELYAIGDAPNQLYMVGSMGCASSMALGLALSRPDRRVVVVDGDGAALMRLGAMSTIGAEAPPNLLHILLDNGQHESTGGQRTASDTTDLAAVAAACGYPAVRRVNDPDGLHRCLRDPSPGLRFVHVPIMPGVPRGLPRPSLAPPQVVSRLRSHLGVRRDAEAEAQRRQPAAPAVSAAAPSMRILVASPVFAGALEELRKRHDVREVVSASPEELREAIRDRQVVVFRSGVEVSAELMRCAPELRLLIRAGSGLDNLDVDYVREHEIELVRIPAPGARAVAELAFSLMLALARQVRHADGLLRRGRWAKHEITGHLLAEKTLGVYGAGNIGMQVGQMGAAWGMKVIGCVEQTSSRRAAEMQGRGMRLVSADDVLRQSDFLSLHVPLKDSTRGLIDADAFARMKPGVFLVNLARGGVVVESALADALRSGQVAGAGLDVHEREGEGAISPLAEFQNVILTPHMGAGTIDTQRRIGQRIIQAIEVHCRERARESARS